MGLIKCSADRKQAYSLFEFIVVGVVIALLLGTLAFYLNRIVEEARKTALHHSLNCMRVSIELYRIHNGNYPNDLRNLTEEAYKFSKTRSIFSVKYIKSISQDTEGYPMDPFGNRYSYDPKTGNVRCVTRGYKDW